MGDQLSVSRTIGMAKVSAKGGFNLFWGTASSTIISSLGIILVARLLTPSEYGLVTIALVAPNLITIFRDWGFDSAMIKYTAQYRSKKEMANVKSILAAGVFFELALGFSLSFISLLLAGFLATNIFQRPDITPLIQVASFTIFSGALLKATQSAFTGYERMELHSLTLVIQSILKSILAPLLIILGLGAFGAIMGTTIAFLVAGAISIIILYIALFRSLHRLNDGNLKILETAKTMFKYGLPLSISAILTGFLAQFYNFLIAIYCTDLAIGNYQVALNFAVLVTFFVTPISIVIFPAFSKLNQQEEPETFRNVFQVSVKYAALLIVPASAAIMVLSQPAVSTLFGEKYAQAPLYLTLYTIIYLYSALGSLSLGSLIASQGKTQVNLKLTLTTFAVGFPLSLLLIPQLRILGLLATNLAAPIPHLIIALWWTKKHFTATINWTSSAKILLASTLAAAITYTAISLLSLPNWITLIIGAIIFIVTYTITSPLIGAINKTDIQNLKEILKELGPLYHLFNFPLNLIEKLIITSRKT